MSKNSSAEPKLPYFDEIFSEQNENNSAYQEAFARNVHFGFWAHPNHVNPTIAEYAKATDELVRQVIRVSNIASNQSIIDIGCGFGGTVAHLDKDFNHMNLLGLNIDQRQIEVARKVCLNKKATNQIRFSVADALTTGEADNSFDRALAVEVIFHFSSRLKFFQEAYRILKPGGELLVTEVVFNKDKIPYIFLKMIQNIPVFLKYVRTIGDLGDPVTIRNYEKLAARTGFVIDKVEDWSQNVLPSFDCLRALKLNDKKKAPSLYAPELLAFASNMLTNKAQKYLAIRLKKPAL